MAEELATAADDTVDEKAAETMEEDAERFPKAIYPAGPAASGHREEPVGNETIFQNDLEEEWERGKKLAELYQTEQEERPADHPLAIARAERAEIEENRELTEKRSEELSEGDTEKLPGTHAKLDELAAQKGHTWSDEDLSVAEKQEELRSA